jgi:hypothetical protein
MKGGKKTKQIKIVKLFDPILVKKKFNPMLCGYLLIFKEVCNP